MGEEVTRNVGGGEPRLSPDHHTLYFSNGYTQAPTYPADRAASKSKLAECEWNTGADNIWSVPLDKWINNR
jgi:hypothetical protein